YGGEDFELVLSLPHELAEFLVQELGAGAAIIGTITPGDEVWLRDSSGVYSDELLTMTRGFQHFSSDIARDN
ncbi:MAG TPA: thiamine-phosphate kinase, partial [Cyanobacteria bacterium UBA11149]|nr:thiamine-phosphate kinase [Cyanobacteria bacterium UBA11149]